jgi:hypothetical protein
MASVCPVACTELHRRGVVYAEESVVRDRSLAGPLFGWHSARATGCSASDKGRHTVNLVKRAAIIGGSAGDSSRALRCAVPSGDRIAPSIRWPFRGCDVVRRPRSGVPRISRCRDGIDRHSETPIRPNMAARPQCEGRIAQHGRDGLLPLKPLDSRADLLDTPPIIS